MKFYLTLVMLVAALLLAVGAASAAEDRKGHGAGGTRTDHASEQGLDTGKAWAGSNEKEEKQPKDKKEKQDRKQNKKQKKEKKHNKGKKPKG